MDFATLDRVGEGRRAARWVAIAIAAMVAIGAAVLLGARLWVGSARGRATMTRKLDDVVARRLGGHAHVGKIAGSLIGGITLDDVVWRDAHGEVGLRARRVVARWSAARALARRPALELRIEGADVDVDRILDGADVDAAAAALAEKRDEVDAVTLTRLDVADATLRMRGHVVRVARLIGVARLDKGEPARDGHAGGHLGDRGELTLSRLDARTTVGGSATTVSVAGGLRWDRGDGSVDAERLRVHAGDSSLLIAGGHADRDGVDVRLSALRLGPDDLRQLSPRAEAPRTALRGEGRVHGPLDAARVDLELRPDAGRLRVDGTMDFVHRRGDAVVTLDDVEADYTPAVLAGAIALRGQVADGAATVTWSASGRYFRREVDPNLQAAALSPPRRRAFATVRPGGRFSGRGVMAARIADRAPLAEMHFHLRIDDPGQAARLVAGPDLRATTRPLLLDGVWQIRPHRAGTLTLHRR